MAAGQDMHGRLADFSQPPRRLEGATSADRLAASRGYKHPWQDSLARKRETVKGDPTMKSPKSHF